MLKQETKTNLKQFAILSIAFLLVLTLFFSLPNFIQTKALGGGFISGTTTSVTVNATTNAGGFGGATTLLALIKGNYIVIEATSYSPSISVSSISDQQSDTYSLAVKSTVFDDNEIWYANYTGTNNPASNTVTVTFSGSTSSTVYTSILTGVVTGSLQTVKSNGTATTVSVASFTPNLNYACINFIVTHPGSVTGTTFGNPAFWYFPRNVHSLTAFDTESQAVNNWNNYGATTVSTTISPTSSPTWDTTVSCFPEGPATTSTTTSTSTTTTTTVFTGQATVTAVTGASTITTTSNLTKTLSTFTSSIYTAQGTATINKTATTITSSTIFTTGNITTTATAIPEPAGSTDLLLILLAILIFLILMVVGVIKRNPFPVLLGSIVLLIMNVGLYTNNVIIYGNNLITTPLWVNEMITLLVIFSFVLCIYQIVKNRR